MYGSASSRVSIDAAELSSESAEAELVLRLGRGGASAHVYFSDLSPGYVELNSEQMT